MKRIAICLLILLVVIGCSNKTTEKVCVLETSMGTMAFRFFENEAPKTSANFQKYVTDGYYNGKEFYRVVKGHVIQAGEGDSLTVPPEFNDHRHLTGTVGLARSNDPNSGSNVFYICLTPRPHLNRQYAVFGQLIEGLDVLEAIGNVEVNEHFSGSVAFHQPKVPVTIEKAYIEERELEPYVEEEE